MKNNLAKSHLMIAMTFSILCAPSSANAKEAKVDTEYKNQVNATIVKQKPEGEFIIPITPTVPSAPDDIWDGTIATEYASGSGTVEDPYIISTAEQLAYLGQNVSNGINYSGQFFVLNANLDLNGENYKWTPIGIVSIIDSNPLDGYFDGQGHVISNLDVNLPSSNHATLFAQLGVSGTIKNLGVEKANIIGYAYSSVIVGLNFGSIDNCYATGVVQGGNTGGGGRAVGGISGLNDGAITNSYNSAAVYGIVRVGGITGENIGMINGCYNNADINRIESNAVEEQYGGIAGYSQYNAVVVFSQNSGTIRGDVLNGGIVGFNGGIVESIYNSGTIIGEKYTGGIVGANNGGAIANCYNKGNLNGNISTGGITGGSSESSIEKCYNAGDINGTISLGGINGDAYGHTEIRKTYNTGILTGTNAIGGIAGTSTESLIIEDSYHTQTINGSSNVGAVIGAYSGALAITNTYYNKDNHPQIDPTPGVVGLTTAEMILEEFAFTLGSDFLHRSNDELASYYPELNVFYNSGNSTVQQDSKESVTVP